MMPKTVRETGPPLGRVLNDFRGSERDTRASFETRNPGGGVMEFFLDRITGFPGLVMEGVDSYWRKRHLQTSKNARPLLARPILAGFFLSGFRERAA